MKIKHRKQIFVLVIPRFEDFSHSYYAGEVAKGASIAASRLTTDILLHVVDRSDHRGWLDSTLLDRKYIDGILFADIDNDVEMVKKAIRSKIPCMVLNNILSQPINWVAIDNKQSAIDAVEYLIKAGHTKIATVAGDFTTQAGVLRLEGYREALRKHDISIPKNYVVEGGFLRTPARSGAEKLFKLNDRPTAIFAASDVMALEVIDVARTHKIKVPEELSVLGFDDNPLCTHNSLGLSTVAQPLIEMGRLGVENLSQIVKGQAKLPVKILLPAKLVIRQSTASFKK
jgi:LacI family transcriptional regulator